MYQENDGTTAKDLRPPERVGTGRHNTLACIDPLEHRRNCLHLMFSSLHGQGEWFVFMCGYPRLAVSCCST